MKMPSDNRIFASHRMPQKIDLLSGRPRRESYDVCLDNLGEEFSYYRDLTKRYSLSRSPDNLFQPPTPPSSPSPVPAPYDDEWLSGASHPTQQIQAPKIIIQSPSGSTLASSPPKLMTSCQVFPRQQQQSILKKTSKYDQQQQQPKEWDRLAKPQSTNPNLDKELNRIGLDYEAFLRSASSISSTPERRRGLNSDGELNYYGGTNSRSSYDTNSSQLYPSSSGSSSGFISPNDVNQYNDLRQFASGMKPNGASSSGGTNTTVRSNPITNRVDNRSSLPFAFDNFSTGGIKGNIATVGAVEPDKPHPPFAKSIKNRQSFY